MSIEKAKEHLKAKGYLDRLIEPEASSATVELAAEALGCRPAEIAKTLSFLVGEKPVMVLAAGTARVDNRKFKDTFHTKAKMIPFDLHMTIARAMEVSAPSVPIQASAFIWTKASKHMNTSIPLQGMTTAA